MAGATVVKHAVNSGYGAAIRTIFAEAKKRNPDVLVIIDADSQHNPAEIPNLVKPIVEGGYDFVIGSRKGQAASIPLYRRFGQKVISRSVNVLTQGNLSDTESGFRAFSRKAIAALELKENGMAVSAETVAEAARLNLKITEVPITVTYTEDSSTLNPVSHGLGVITRIMAMISEQRPMFFFGLVGMFLVAIGLVAGVFALRLYSQSGVVSVGWALVAIFFLILGALSFYTGLTLHTISSMIQDMISKIKK
jgi:glycosyltransferase involved in cell wall biosynthesis